jgi:hypothetical protein
VNLRESPLAAYCHSVDERTMCHSSRRCPLWQQELGWTVVHDQ